MNVAPNNEVNARTKTGARYSVSHTSLPRRTACLERHAVLVLMKAGDRRDDSEVEEPYSLERVFAWLRDLPEQIARLLNNKATALMDRERQGSLGIKQAHWLYSGAPCELNPKKPTGQDTAHRAANGKLYDVSTGIFLNGKWTWPGVEPGCRCISKSVVPGFS